MITFSFEQGVNEWQKKINNGECDLLNTKDCLNITSKSHIKTLVIMYQKIYLFENIAVYFLETLISLDDRSSKVFLVFAFYIYKTSSRIQ